jgi:CRISPR/Cas system CSM-associated protein Csm3 (group 7 of RAMP superfamily)
MARTITHTLILEGELIALTPIHVGGADGGDTTDMPLAVNGRGSYYLPGTSLAGAIRAWEAGDDTLWGFAEEKEGHASYIIIDDAPALDAPQAELWHGVGIDRKTGGAFKGVKFDRQVLPQGTRFAFRLQREVESSNELESARAQMGRLKAALEAGEIAFGGSTTRGFGRLRLEKSMAREIAWNMRSGLLAWLEGKEVHDYSSTWQAALQNAQEHHTASTLTITIHWQPDGPLMSKAAYDGITADMLPFVSRTRDGKLALTLPGSAIKGALRQQAERIVRTVLEQDGAIDSRHHFEQIDLPLVARLFGGARGKDKGHGKQQAPAKGARGLVAVETCYAELALTKDEWRQFDTPGENGESNWPRHLYKADHVAIDRWTGGAAEGALYNAIEPDQTTRWHPIRLHFDLRRGKEELAALALLWLTLRDLQLGRIPLGFGVNRGYGSITVTQIDMKGLAALDPQIPDTLSAARLDREHPLYPRLREAWLSWLEQQQKEVAA